MNTKKELKGDWIRYEKFRGLHYEILNKFEKNDNEIKFIKIKFTELSELILDLEEY